MQNETTHLKTSLASYLKIKLILLESNQQKA